MSAYIISWVPRPFWIITVQGDISYDTSNLGDQYSVTAACTALSLCSYRDAAGGAATPDQTAALRQALRRSAKFVLDILLLI